MSIGSPQLRGSGFVEEFGVIIEATSVKSVKVDESGDNLEMVFRDAMNDSSIPQPGEILSQHFPNVRVERRIPRVIGREGNKIIVEVTCEYKLGRWQLPSDSEPRQNQQYSLRGGGSLTGIETEVYYPDRVSMKPVPITVTYKGKEQGGRISALAVQGHFTREMWIATDNPDGIVDVWLNYVNSTTWRGYGPREWLCTRCDYEVVNPVSIPAQCRFEFDFERRPTKWVYTVSYQDESGKTPADLVDENAQPKPPPPYGRRDIPWHPEKDFNPWFPK